MEVMKQGGASSQAMAFTRIMQDNCYLAKFTKMGKVDLAYVFYPSRANTNYAYFMVNGNPPLVSTEKEGGHIDITKDPVYSAWSRKYREIGRWDPAVFQTMEALPGGGQRFIFAYELINGPRSGEKVGWALVAFDFDGRGRFLQTRLLRLTRKIQG